MNNKRILRKINLEMPQRIKRVRSKCEMKYFYNIFKNKMAIFRKEWKRGNNNKKSQDLNRIKLEIQKIKLIKQRIQTIDI